MQHPDQASGLRRLFQPHPPTIVALFALGQSPHALIEAALRQLQPQQRTVLLDENLSPQQRTDLLQMLDGATKIRQLITVQQGIPRVAVAGAMAAWPLLDHPRRRLIGASLDRLRRYGDLFALAADPSTRHPSPLLRAAHRHLMIVEASASGVRQASACLNQLGAIPIAVSIYRASDPVDAQALFCSLQDMAQRKSGSQLISLGELEYHGLPLQPWLDLAQIQQQNQNFSYRLGIR
jgi:flagellar biosynthesis protein FlhG